MKRVLIDSSGWVELFCGGSKAKKFEKFILEPYELIVPSLVIFDVYRKIKKTLGESKAIFAVTQMQRGTEVGLDAHLALYAADISLSHPLPMADAIVYATALFHKALLITADNDFRGLAEVEIF